MPEIETPPISFLDDDGDEVCCFNSSHSAGDIVRWLMQSTSGAEEVHRMLGEELRKSALSRLAKR